MSILERAPQTYEEKTRPQRVAALMWVAEHAGILADGYAIRISSGPGASKDYAEVGEVNVQGHRGSLQSLIARLGAVPVVAERDGNYREWVAIEGDVHVRFIEEKA